MQRRAELRVIGAIGTTATLIWKLYSNLTTAAQLPSDAGALAKMLADPPVYLPWMILVGFVLLLGWSFWPKKKHASDEEETMPSLPSSPNSPVTTGGAGTTIAQHHSGSGHNLAVAGDLTIGAKRFQMTDEIAGQIHEQLDHSRPVTVAHTIDSRSERYAGVLRAYLQASGLEIGDVITGGFNSAGSFGRPVTIFRDGIRIGGMVIAEGAQIVMIDAESGDE